jgi:hypothetical protein
VTGTDEFAAAVADENERAAGWRSTDGVAAAADYAFARKRKRRHELESRARALAQFAAEPPTFSPFNAEDSAAAAGYPRRQRRRRYVRPYPWGA